MASRINGEVNLSSKTLSHVTGYPVIHDSIAYFKQNPYGQKSIALGDSAYQMLAKPVIPYLAKPYEYVSPYVRKADLMGDDALSKVDTHVPVLQKPIGELWTDGKSFVFFPVHKGTETKDHLFSIYNSEYKKVGGDGLMTSGKALISVGLVVTSEALTWIGDLIRSGKVQAKETGNEVAQQARN